jgi:hypothetical protein
MANAKVCKVHVITRINGQQNLKRDYDTQLNKFVDKNLKQTLSNLLLSNDYSLQGGYYAL